ncbi:MAG: hypothetical protein M3463_14730 [Verrucomicrobiota bacterium]|nr:hypothetical protein [Verrucomicrobiota bacterium]
MDGKALVTRIALLIIGFSLFGVLFWGVFVGGRGMFGNIVGLVINVVLAFFLIAGHGWARWLTVIRCGFGAIFSVTAFVGLPAFGISRFSILGLWLLATIVFSIAVAAYLTTSKRVNEYFNPSSGF